MTRPEHDDTTARTQPEPVFVYEWEFIELHRGRPVTHVGAPTRPESHRAVLAAISDHRPWWQRLLTRTIKNGPPTQ